MSCLLLVLKLRGMTTHTVALRSSYTKQYYIYMSATTIYCHCHEVKLLNLALSQQFTDIVIFFLFELPAKIY